MEIISAEEMDRRVSYLYVLPHAHPHRPGGYGGRTCLECFAQKCWQAFARVFGGCKTPRCNGTGDPAGCTATFCFSNRR